MAEELDIIKHSTYVENIKTVGELRKVLEGIDDSIPLSMSATGYDFEGDDYVGIVAKDDTLRLTVSVLGNVCTIRNTDDDEMIYEPDFA